MTCPEAPGTRSASGPSPNSRTAGAVATRTGQRSKTGSTFGPADWRSSAGAPEGDELTFHAFYFDIVPGQRIIYAYEMSFKGERLSASLVTIEFAPVDRLTRMKFTEQAVFLAGEGTGAQRVLGTGEGFDRLVDVMAHEVSDAA